MTDEEYEERVDALLQSHGMRYSSPACDMGPVGLAFRSPSANVIVPSASKMDATQKRVTIERLEKQLSN